LAPVDWDETHTACSLYLHLAGGLVSSRVRTSSESEDRFGPQLNRLSVMFLRRSRSSGQARSVPGRALPCSLLALIAITACHNDFVPTTPLNPGTFTLNPCSESGTLTLPVAQTARVDCSNGGTTVTLAGNGASYLVVAQFPVDLVPNGLVPYHVSSGTAISASRTPLGAGVFASRGDASASATS